MMCLKGDQGGEEISVFNHDLLTYTSDKPSSVTDLIDK
jgi:hypothetical protein